MEIDFGTQLYDKVQIWILNIDEDYTVPTSGVTILSHDVITGVKDANDKELNIL